MRNSNPILNTKLFEKTPAGSLEGKMSVAGSINKTAFFLFLVLLSACYTWKLALFNAASLNGWMLFGLFGGIIACIATCVKKEWASITGSIYALCQGLFLGGISSIFEKSFPGIVIQTVGLTMGTFAAMLFVYRSGLIPVTERLRMGILSATMGICGVYLFSMILGFFGFPISFLHGGGFFGILFSLFVVGLAAFHLLLDFDFIEKGSRHGAPAYMEWFAAFGLVVSLLWLYVELLRLLSKLRGRE